MRKVSRDSEDGFGTWPARLRGLLRDNSEPAARSAALAALLHECAPAALVTTCCLPAGEGSAVALHPEDTKWRSALESWSAADAAPDASIALRAGRTRLDGFVVFLDEPANPRRWLLVGLPPRTPASVRAALQTAVRLAASLLAGELQLEVRRREVEDWLLVSEAMSGLAHDFNNHLNSMVLQAAVVQMKVDETTRAEVETIRQGALQVAKLLRPFQQFRDQRRQERTAVDLERLLREAAGSVAIEVQAPLPAVRAPAFEMRRLLHHLLADCPGPVALSSDGQEVRLTLPTAAQASEEIEHVLRWQAVQSLARLTGGILRQDETRTTIAWPVE
jgi:hypothetical protein